MSYYDIVTKEIALPSGATARVRRQTKLEAIIIGQPPAFFLRAIRAKQKLNGADTPEIDDSTPEQDQQLLEFLAKQARIMLTKCCGSIVFDGERLKIVDKAPEDVETGEISWAMISDGDASTIMNAINELNLASSMDMGAIDTFREKSETAEGAGRTVEKVPLPSN
jgi:hypothetical protein